MLLYADWNIVDLLKLCSMPLPVQVISSDNALSVLVITVILKHIQL
jgi:hypothetical protein